MRDRTGRIVAHRGASAVAPENTLAALRAARAAGADWVEVDVSLLGDGTPVLCHDPTLDRCSDRTGPLADLRAADLAGIDAGGWFDPRFAGEPLPRLDAALAEIAALGLAVNLEMKPHGRDPERDADALARALAAGPQLTVLVSSFDHTALAALRRRRPETRLAALWWTPPEDWPDRLAALGADALHMDHRRLAPDHLRAARAAGVDLRVYTCNEPERLAWARTEGLAGVVTDDPARYLADAAWAAWAAG